MGVRGLVSGCETLVTQPEWLRPNGNARKRTGKCYVKRGPKATWLLSPNRSWISRSGTWSCQSCIGIMLIIQQECGIIVKTIRAEMKSELVPLAEEKANHGKVVKAQIRELWSLEYEIEEIQTEFAKGIGSIDIGALTDDFVEDVMLQSKPLQP